MKKNKPKILKQGRQRLKTLYVFLGFFMVLVLLFSVVMFAIIPAINKNLSNLGVSSIDEFISFYQDLNRYVHEDDIIKNGFTEVGPKSDYQLAYNKLMAAGINVFEDDGLIASNIAVSKFDTNDYSAYEADPDGVELTDREYAALLNNALRREDFTEKLNITLIDEYQLNIHIKEISLKKSADGNFIMTTVLRLKLTELLKKIPEFFRSLFPDTIYVLTESIITYNDLNESEILEYGINVNNMSKKSHETAVKILNKQYVAEDKENFTLQKFSEDLNDILLEKTEAFAGQIHSVVKIIEKTTIDEDNPALPPKTEILFKLNYIS